ncbi:MAG: hypothetical protein EAZ97_09430 [Bacteroidetes bacterium]|nr:MAG: hypothetical protein EAZ97_09430 [Bacteroidota bacterium]
MKRYLLLIRHAESEISSMDGSDFNRNLTVKGFSDASLLGEELQTKNFQTDYMAVSAALRTSQTAQKIAEKINFPSEKIYYDQALYSPSADFLFHFLTKIATNHQQVVIINHNPAVSRVASYLTGKYLNMSTATAICLSFDLETWAELTADIAQIAWVLNS